MINMHITLIVHKIIFMNIENKIDIGCEGHRYGRVSLARVRSGFTKGGYMWIDTRTMKRREP